MSGEGSKSSHKEKSEKNDSIDSSRRWRGVPPLPILPGHAPSAPEDVSSVGATGSYGSKEGDLHHEAAPSSSPPASYQSLGFHGAGSPNADDSNRVVETFNVPVSDRQLSQGLLADSKKSSKEPLLPYPSSSGAGPSGQSMDLHRMAQGGLSPALTQAEREKAKRHSKIVRVPSSRSSGSNLMKPPTSPVRSTKPSVGSVYGMSPHPQPKGNMQQRSVGFFSPSGKKGSCDSFHAMSLGDVNELTFPHELSDPVTPANDTIPFPAGRDANVGEAFGRFSDKEKYRRYNLVQVPSGQALNEMGEEVSPQILPATGSTQQYVSLRADKYEGDSPVSAVGRSNRLSMGSLSQLSRGPCSNCFRWIRRMRKKFYKIMHRSRLGDRVLRFLRSSNNWLLALMVGVLTATIGAGIEIWARSLNTLKLGYCRDISWFTFRFMADCTQNRPDWTAWSCSIPCYFHANMVTHNFVYEDCIRNCPAPKNLFEFPPGLYGVSYFFSFTTYILIPLLYVLVAVVVTNTIAPAARGSGIPEVKTILGGFVLPGVLSPTTLAVKVFCLVLVVASGLAAGKEGPLVHVSCCFATIVWRLFASGKNARRHRKYLELLSAACAAGVATAFGAPLGGVLFAFEEVSSFFPPKTLWRTFFCATAASVTLLWIDPDGTHKISLFEVAYRDIFYFWEFLPVAFIGILGGFIGASFIRLNLWVNKLRKKYSGAGTLAEPGAWSSAFGPRPQDEDEVHAHKRHVSALASVVCEMMVLVTITAILSYPCDLLRPLTTNVIHELFKDCRPGSSREPWAEFLCLEHPPKHYANQTEVVFTKHKLYTFEN